MGSRDGRFARWSIRKIVESSGFVSRAPERGYALPSDFPAGSIACSSRSTKDTTSRARSLVAARTTGGASPAASASCQRAAHRHQWSPGVQARKTPAGIRGAQIVAPGAAEGEEPGGHHGADRVDAQIVRTGVAAAVAVETGDRILVAGLQLAAQHLF